jgi:hypothetical protein
MPSFRLANVLARLKEESFDFDKILSGLEKKQWGLGKDGSWKITFDKIIESGTYYITLIEANTMTGADTPQRAAPVQQDSNLFIAFFCKCGNHSASLMRTTLEKNMKSAYKCEKCGQYTRVNEIISKADQSGINRADFIAQPEERAV